MNSSLFIDENAWGCNKINVKKPFKGQTRDIREKFRGIIYKQ